MKKITKEQLAENMDALGCGSPSIDEIEAIAKSRGASSIKYIATVGFLDPCDTKIFFAETKEDMAAQIEQAANGREYVARYSGMCFTSNQTSASIEDAVIIADFDNWTIMVVSKDGEIPAQCQHYIRYVWNYLMYGRGLFKNRFTSVATRLFTRTLKPSQVSASN